MNNNKSHLDAVGKFDSSVTCGYSLTVLLIKSLFLITLTLPLTFYCTTRELVNCCNVTWQEL